MEKTNLIVNNLRQNLDAIFSFATQVSYTEGHPLPVIQASKSLIGMDLNHPPKNLLKWLEKYIHEFQPDFQLPENFNDTEKPAILSTIQLAALIKSGTIEDSRKYLHHILQVADHSYIMEFFLEISLDYTINSTLFCWSAYKSIQFMDPKERIATLFLSLDCIYFSQKTKNDESDNLNKFYFYSHNFSIINTSLIRSDKIETTLLEKVKTLQIDNSYNDCIPEQLLTYIREEGEIGIANYLASLGIKEISCEYILLLDAVRLLFKYTQNSNAIFNCKKEETSDI